MIGEYDRENVAKAVIVCRSCRYELKMSERMNEWMNEVDAWRHDLECRCNLMESNQVATDVKLNVFEACMDECEKRAESARAQVKTLERKFVERQDTLEKRVRELEMLNSEMVRSLESKISESLSFVDERMSELESRDIVDLKNLEMQFVARDSVVEEKVRELEKKAAAADEVKKLEERFSSTEETVTSLIDKFLTNEIEVCKRVDGVSEYLINTEERVFSVEGIQSKFDNVISNLNVTIADVGDRMKAMEEKNDSIELQLKSFSQEWPTLETANQWITVKGKQAKKNERPVPVTREQKKGSKITFADKCKDLREGTILLIGDSMVRGIGNHLKADNEMFGKLDFGGARIEDIKEKLPLIGDKPDSHVIVMAGTNNLRTDGTEIIMKKYRQLLEELVKLRLRKVSLIGILPRKDIWGDEDYIDYMESKRISINMRLRDLCKEYKFEFLDVDINRNTMLDRKGLHLNNFGQDTVARAVFRHSKLYLN
jgi:hypothetical protein